MSETTGISWTDATWNPVTGCSKLSQGCKNCYALREWPRLSAPRPKPNVYTGREFTDVQCHPERLDQPLRWSKPRRIFVNSMSDLFHEDVPFEFIDSVMAVMWLGVRHSYQVLTKRIERAAHYFEDLQALSPAAFEERLAAALELMRAATPERPLMCDEIISVGGRVGAAHIPPTLWMGASVEDQPTADERIPHLVGIRAPVIFLSAEPLLDRIDLDPRLLAPIEGGSQHGQRFIDWVIAGGESGPKARPSHPDWFRSLRDQCAAAGVPFHFKQWGEWTPGENVERERGTVDTAFLWDDQWSIHPLNLATDHGHVDDQPDLYRVGKKAAGRLLDGVEHNGFPEAEC